MPSSRFLVGVQRQTIAYCYWKISLLLVYSLPRKWPKSAGPRNLKCRPPETLMPSQIWDPKLRKQLSYQHTTVRVSTVWSLETVKGKERTHSSKAVLAAK